MLDKTCPAKIQYHCFHFHIKMSNLQKVPMVFSMGLSMPKSNPQKVPMVLSMGTLFFFWLVFLSMLGSASNLEGFLMMSPAKDGP